MKPPISASVGSERLTALTPCTRVIQVGFQRISETVLVNKVNTGVVRRVDVDQLNLASVALLPQL